MYIFLKHYTFIYYFSNVCCGLFLKLIYICVLLSYLFIVLYYIYIYIISLSIYCIIFIYLLNHPYLPIESYISTYCMILVAIVYLVHYISLYCNILSI